MSAVIVLHAALDAQACPDAARSLLERLPYAKRLELEAREAGARRASLRGIELVVLGAARFGRRGPVIADLCFPAGGKPYLRGGPAFSVSHTARRVAVAFASRGEIGLDLEDLAESGATRGTAARLSRWTATEAVLKAAGRGLRSAREVEIDPTGGAARFEGRDYVLTPLALAPGVVAHLATDEPAATVDVDRVGCGA